YKMENGKRVPTGEPIANYYPAALSEQMYYQVQQNMQDKRERFGYFGGKTGKAKNLFMHVVKCGLCGSALHYFVLLNKF
ncbi:unnamed protein product, partial [marine sediment metagenome]